MDNLTIFQLGCTFAFLIVQGCFAYDNLNTISKTLVLEEEWTFVAVFNQTGNGKGSEIYYNISYPVISGRLQVVFCLHEHIQCSDQNYMISSLIETKKFCLLRHPWGGGYPP